MSDACCGDGTYDLKSAISHLRSSHESHYWGPDGDARVMVDFPLGKYQISAESLPFDEGRISVEVREGEVLVAEISSHDLSNPPRGKPRGFLNPPLGGT